MTKKLKIVLADDHPIVLMGVRDLIESDGRYTVIAEAYTPSDLIKIIEAESPDVVITDYNMPGDDAYGDGARLVEYLLRNYPDCALLILTMLSNNLILSRLYEIGVSGVILKNGDLNEILVALDKVCNGQKYEMPVQARNIPGNPEGTINERIASLSVKEFEVLRHFVSGLTVGEIARNLNRSLKTVSAQKISAMRKLGVETDQALMTFAVETKIFD